MLSSSARSSAKKNGLLIFEVQRNVLKDLLLQIHISWDDVPDKLVNNHRGFEESSCFHLQHEAVQKNGPLNFERGGSMVLRNVSSSFPLGTELCLKKLEASDHLIYLSIAIRKTPGLYM
jgi:hypothetical protein